MSFTRRYSQCHVFVASALCVMLAGCASQRKTVLLTGYWPPTNEMLRPFSPNTAINPEGWQGKNWQGTGYDVYAYFPEFPEGHQSNPAGSGDFVVDYQNTRADFERITRQLNPAIIISYGQGMGPWEIEVNAPRWATWNGDFIEPIFPEPLDGPETMHTTLPAERIQKAVQAAVPEARAWVDGQGDPGNFLCGYLAYLAMRYQAEHAPCTAAGFIHVGPNVDVSTARKANEATLRAVLAP